MMPCPTLQQLLEAERDAWFNPKRAEVPRDTRWKQASKRLSMLLGRSALERYLLRPKELNDDQTQELHRASA